MGSYEYKYLINGIEFLDSSKPSAKNHHGIVNNILTISGQAKGEITVHHLLPKQVSYSSKDLAEETKVEVNDKGENEEEKSKVIFIEEKYIPKVGISVNMSIKDFY